MNHLHGIGLLTVFIALCCVSCGDDPVLVEKRARQQAEILRLKGELSLIEEKLQHLPPDVSADLEKAGKDAAQQTAEIARLEAELSQLAARKNSLQNEFDAYRAKYPIK